MKKILLSVLLSSLGLTCLRADVVYNEKFNYIDGVSYVVGTNNLGQTNWFVHSGAGDSFIANKKLTVSMNGSADVNRPYYTGGSGVYTNSLANMFASFTVSCTNQPSISNYFGHFYLNTSTFHGRVWNAPGSQPGTWKLGVTTLSGVIGVVKWFPVDLATNTDYQVVVNWDETQGASSIATIWVNPLTSADPSVVAQDAVAGVISISFGFRQPSGAGTGRFLITNLVVATTFEEAATNVWSTNAVAPLIVYSPKSGTNFTGFSTLLSAVAAGQGLGSLTYTWYKDGALYDDPNSTPDNNTLSFPSAAVSDSGAYQLVVATPFGLSATSTVANLWITNAPVPPTITLQPTNTTVYFGQTATLAVGATGPGSINYTWYRDNVLVSGSPNIDGPSLVIPNVQANNGTTGTYRVAVSNEFGGVLSSNAVLSATSVPSVSIAFLRTLVDANYLATNSSQVFQVTGTVTTFTNLTSANTSSYYLQDSTAGINIFATLGSTFRPMQGDVLTFVGVLSSFSSTLELLADPVNNSLASYVVHSNDITTLPEPVIIPFNITNNLAFCETNLEGRIVMLTNVYFGANAGATISTTANASITVTNAAGEAFILNFSPQDQDTAGQTLPEFARTVVGPFTQNLANGGTPRNAAYQVTVTRFSDIVTNPLSLTQTAPGVLSWAAAPVTYPYSVRAASDVVGPYVAITNKLRFTDANGTFTDPNAGGSQKYYRLSTP